MGTFFRGIPAVAHVTLLETVRQPVFLATGVIGALLIAAAPEFALFHMGEEIKVVVDLGLSTILTIPSAAAALACSTVISGEIERRTAAAAISKPISREAFVVGRYLGILAGAGIQIACLAAVLLATVRFLRCDGDGRWQMAAWCAACGTGAVLAGVVSSLARRIRSRGPDPAFSFLAAYFAAFGILLLRFRGSDPGWDFRLLAGALSSFCHLWILCAAAVAVSTRAGLVPTFLATAALFLAGHVSGYIVSLAASALPASFRPAAVLLRAIIPDLDLFNVADALATARMDDPVPLPPLVFAGTAAYAALYSAALLLVACALFRERDLA
ncbi:MAG: ABC transporter permease [Planctomycetota bacterium]|nr:ABC transporter permease [Planctomycetota bacterium]